LLLDIEPGDEVIVPAFTFVSSANAFLLRGARPVFADIRGDTLNIDEAKLPKLVNDKTKAIVVVHYAGVACEMDEILAAAGSVPVVEDNAHGLFGRYRGRWLGSIGAFGAQSFHETKNFTCGEGGALLVNDARYIERAEIVREYGTDRSRFLRGQVDRYTWVDRGSSSLPADLLAAVLLSQLERWQSVQDRRRETWQHYQAGLADWAAANRVRLPTVPRHCEPAYHLFYLLLPSPGARRAFMAHMRQRGVQTAFHYQPLNRSPMGLRLGARDCPTTEDVAERLVRLPFFNELEPDERDRVVAATCAFRA
jgi:dTDP-4-amino-4,6-dideoxygalactose transaminase